MASAKRWPPNLRGFVVVLFLPAWCIFYIFRNETYLLSPLLVEDSLSLGTAIPIASCHIWEHSESVNPEFQMGKGSWDAQETICFFLEKLSPLLVATIASTRNDLLSPLLVGDLVFLQKLFPFWGCHICEHSKWVNPEFQMGKGWWSSGKNAFSASG